MAQRKTTDIRAHLLDTASALFYSEGVRAVGIERILRESGVAKATMYHHFTSKDELVAAFVRTSAQEWQTWLSRRVEALATDPADRIFVVFDALGERFAVKGFRGCAFNNTIAELSDPKHPAHIAAREHKEAVEAMLQQWLIEGDHLSDEHLVTQLMMLIDGSITRAIRCQDPSVAIDAKLAAIALVSMQTN